jgi:hypothetical protein
MRLMLEPGFGGASIQLTDHFSVPFDLEDRFFSPYELVIGADGALADGKRIAPGKWTDLELRWDGAKRSAGVFVNGEPVSTLTSKREGAPLSYLRIRPISNSVDKGGLLIDDVQVEVTP